MRTFPNRHKQAIHTPPRITNGMMMTHSSEIGGILDSINCMDIWLSFPERSEGNEVMKIAVRDDKCFGGRKDFGGAEMVQGGSAAP